MPFVVVLDADGPLAFRRMREAGVVAAVIGALGSSTTARTLLAYPWAAPGAHTAYDVFPRSYPTLTHRGLMDILADVYPPWDSLSCPRLADAVAAAALRRPTTAIPARSSSS